MTDKGKKIAFLFPGQGRAPSGPPPPSPIIEELFDLAATRGLPLREWFADRPDERFRSTRTAQPTLFIDSVAREINLQSRGISPSAVAGHSLGEYAALVSAGVITASDALEIVIERGRLMKGVEGGMVAVVGLDIERVKEICAEVGSDVTIANHNGPTQIVVAGSKEGLSEIATLAVREGGRGIPLRVSGPFHSPAMRPAEEELAPVIERTRFSNPKIPVVSGVSGRIERDADGLKDLMKRQITSCVRWVDVIKEIGELGVTHAVEIGSGDVLTRLSKRVTENIEFLTYEEAQNGGI